MSRKYLAAFVTVAIAALPGAAIAQSSTYTLTYTTFDDGQNAPISLSATLTGTTSQTPGAFTVTSLSGKRDGVAIIGFDPYSAFYSPAMVPSGYQFSTFFDAALVTLDFYTADGTEYLISRGPSDTSFYHEFEDPYGETVGRLIQPGSLTLQAADTVPGAVPEPATWAMMIAGFAALGYALRRRRAGVALPALA